MKTCHPVLVVLALALALTAIGWPLAARAQSPVTAASAPAAIPGKNTPRALSPTEKRDSATAPGEVRPVDPVIPQISLPLGRTPPAPDAARPAGPRSQGGAAEGGIDDSVARCKAHRTRTERAECLDRLARAKPTR